MHVDDFLKKVAFFGLGTATVTKDKIEEGVKKLIAKGEITAAQGEKLIKQWLKDADKTSKEIARKVDQGVNNALNKAGVVRRKDVEALERRIAKLEKALAAQPSPKRPVTPGKATKKPKTQGQKKTPSKK